MYLLAGVALLFSLYLIMMSVEKRSRIVYCLQWQIYWSFNGLRANCSGFEWCRGIQQNSDDICCYSSHPLDDLMECLLYRFTVSSRFGRDRGACCTWQTHVETKALCRGGKTNGRIFDTDYYSKCQRPPSASHGYAVLENIDTSFCSGLVCLKHSHMQIMPFSEYAVHHTDNKGRRIKFGICGASSN